MFASKKFDLRSWTKIGVVALAAVFALSLVGCGGSGSGGGNADGTRDITDDTGRTVTVPTTIETYLPAGYPAQIVLFALAPDEMVGLATQWSDYELTYVGEDAGQIEYVGGIYGAKGDINAETVAVLDPDVIIDIGEAKEGIVDELNALQEQLGIPVLHYECSLDEMDECYTKLGDLLGKQDAAKALADYCSAFYKQLIAFSDGLDKVSAVYCLGDRGLNVIAKGSYHAEALDILVDNIAVVENPSAKGTGNEIDMEQLYNWDPEVILFAPNSVYENCAFDEAANDSNWSQLQAIENGTYYEVPLGPINWIGFPPSVQRILGCYWLETLLYPDQCDFELYDVVSEYFDLFYHYDLSQSEFDVLVQNSIGK